jgi:hypothetical protein
MADNFTAPDTCTDLSNPEPRCQQKPLVIHFPITLMAKPGSAVILDGGAKGNIAITDSSTYETKKPGGDLLYDKYPMITVWISQSIRDGLPEGQEWVTIKGLELRNSGTYRGIAIDTLRNGSPSTRDWVINTTMGAGIQVWNSKARILNNNIHDISGGHYDCRGGAIFAIGDSVVIQDNTLEDNFGGYYGGAIFVTSGAMGGLECTSPNRDPDLPCDMAWADIRRNIFRKNIANFGGAVLLARGGFDSNGPPWTDIPINQCFVEENLFVGNSVREFDAGHPHSGASAMYVATPTFSIKRNTVVSNNWGHNYVIRNTAAVAIPWPPYPFDSYVKQNIFSDNRGGGLVFGCAAEEFAYNTFNTAYNIFFNNFACNGTVFNFGIGSVRGGDYLDCIAPHDTTLNCCPSSNPRSFPCCSPPVAGATPCEPPQGVDCGQDHPPAECLPTWYAIPDSGNTNRVKSVSFCNPISNPKYELHSSSFAIAANNPWNLPLGWTQTIACTGGGGGVTGCPHVSVWDGQGYALDNSLLPLAERVDGSPPYVTDCYPLRIEPDISGGRVRLQVSEFESDLAFLDEVQLLAIDLPIGITLGADPTGKLAFYREVGMPLAAADTAGMDVLDSLSFSDSMGVVLEEGGEMRVVLDTSEWAAKRPFGGGGGVGTSSQKQITEAKQARAKWTPLSGMSQANFYGLDGGIEVSLVGLGLPGGAVVIDTLMPRRDWSDQYIDFDSLALAVGDSTEIALRWLGDHKLDRFILAERADVVEPDTLDLLVAEHAVYGDVSDLLSAADSAYVTVDVDEMVSLEFAAPSSPPTGLRRYALITNGYYLLLAGKLRPDSLSSEVPANFALHSASPNPSGAHTQFRFDLPRQGAVTITIYDVSGRSVRELVRRIIPAGHHATVWDGRDDQGRTAGAGIYFARMEMDGEQRTSKFVLIR